MMLSAILKGKIPVPKKEDTLTSSVFDYLLLLPSDMVWKILKESCYENTLPNEVGTLCHYEFWPHWDAKDTENRNYVEPDIFLQFEKLDVIIEAKRKDDKQQSCGQWTNEITAYETVYGKDKEVVLIALGGIKKDNEIKISNAKIVKCRWRRLLARVVAEKKSIKNIKPDDDSIEKILDSVQKSLELHDYFELKWLESLLDKNKLLNFEESQKQLLSWRINYGSKND